MVSDGGWLVASGGYADWVAGEDGVTEGAVSCARVDAVVGASAPGFTLVDWTPPACAFMEVGASGDVADSHVFTAVSRCRGPRWGRNTPRPQAGSRIRIRRWCIRVGVRGVGGTSPRASRCSPDASHDDAEEDFGARHETEAAA